MGVGLAGAILLCFHYPPALHHPPGSLLGRWALGDPFWFLGPPGLLSAPHSSRYRADANQHSLTD